MQAQYAFVGLGEMGKRMATNLAKSLLKENHPPLIVYNRSSDGLDAFIKWAEEKGLPERAYRVMTDLKAIAATSV